MNRAKEIRKKTGLSQQKFAAFYGIPTRNVQNWEQGVSEAPEYVLDLLERVVKLDFKQDEK